MDQKKIGMFIAQCRKEKNMTQAMLAEKLGVTDKSVSRWENGKTMPDLSMYEPLCSALEITVSELLYAEKMDREERAEYSEKSALSLLGARKELEILGVFTEVLIAVGIVITFTLRMLLADNTVHMVTALVCGWFVWGFGLVMRMKVRKALQKMGNGE